MATPADITEELEDALTNPRHRAVRGEHDAPSSDDEIVDDDGDAAFLDEDEYGWSDDDELPDHLLSSLVIVTQRAKKHDKDKGYNIGFDRKATFDDLNDAINEGLYQYELALRRDAKRAAAAGGASNEKVQAVSREAWRELMPPGTILRTESADSIEPVKAPKKFMAAPAPAPANVAAAIAAGGNKKAKKPRFYPVNPPADPAAAVKPDTRQYYASDSVGYVFSPATSPTRATFAAEEGDASSSAASVPAAAAAALQKAVAAAAAAPALAKPTQQQTQQARPPKQQQEKRGGGSAPRSRKTSMRASAAVNGSTESLESPIGFHEHPSHELLRENGFIQHKYFKYHAKALKERKRLGVGCAEMNTLYRKHVPAPVAPGGAPAPTAAPYQPRGMTAMPVLVPPTMALSGEASLPPKPNVPLPPADYPSRHVLPVLAGANAPVTVPVPAAATAAPTGVPQPRYNAYPAGPSTYTPAPAPTAPYGYIAPGYSPYTVDTETLQLYLRGQIEYYFSVGNLCKDLYIRRLMNQDG
ncbi:hypothetical protein AMAG_09713 [Allomyces macrogynus ATCC 38327]|uniref:HTH La-type RNA-binding domain-containing protein n=1 Tax=Allomyces macrogynus (strain ATCC 38327) TaxID=578462 RepID=A0A0L0ST46_ALLM3|nr:hypothetical protein AMAG_09713 [Allomyces macrogynus ATCC 38327]|eukprot:KNE65733.1 hypothetical protein AMAG_09713 [Allomyces macrogynus ATCC 38327]